MKKITLFCVLGWEERFLYGTNHILENYNIQRVYLIRFKDYMDMRNMKENYDSLTKTLKKKEIDLKIIDLEYTHSVSNWLKLQDVFKSIKLQDVILNITTFPRETIWTFLFFLRMCVSKVTYIYYKPESYDKSIGGLTKNYQNPRLLFKHSGIFDINKELVLFIITGFDHRRMDLLIEHYEPTKVIYLSQKGEQFENMIRNCGVAPKTAHKNIDFENLEIDCYNINESSISIRNLIESHDQYNIIITSQGPKTSAISTYLGYLNNRRVALAYVPAREFSGDYSSGFDNHFVIGEVEYKNT